MSQSMQPFVRGPALNEIPQHDFIMPPAPKRKWTEQTPYEPYFCSFEGELVEIPLDTLTEDGVLDQVFSIETLSTFLNDQDWSYLISFLPKCDQEQGIKGVWESLERLMKGEPFHFGSNPLTKFKEKMLDGACHHTNASETKKKRLLDRDQYRQSMSQYQEKMLTSILQWKRAVGLNDPYLQYADQIPNLLDECERKIVGETKDEGKQQQQPKKRGRADKSRKTNQQRDSGHESFPTPHELKGSTNRLEQLGGDPSRPPFFYPPGESSATFSTLAPLTSHPAISQGNGSSPALNLKIPPSSGSSLGPVPPSQFSSKPPKSKSEDLSQFSGGKSSKGAGSRAGQTKKSSNRSDLLETEIGAQEIGDNEPDKKKVFLFFFFFLLSSFSWFFFIWRVIE